MEAVRVARTVEIIPPPRSENIEIGRACHFHLELVGTVTSPNEMRMRIHKTRHEYAPIRIESWFVGVSCLEFSRSTHRNNLFIAHKDCAIFDDAKRAERVTALRPAGKGEELR